MFAKSHTGSICPTTKTQQQLQTSKLAAERLTCNQFSDDGHRRRIDYICVHAYKHIKNSNDSTHASTTLSEQCHESRHRPYTYMHTLHNIIIHYSTLQYIISHHITSHCITLHYIALHYITSHYITLHYTALHYNTLHHITLHRITLQYITSHYITLHYITLHYITLHYITLHYITLHYITLHYAHMYACMFTLMFTDVSKTRDAAIDTFLFCTCPHYTGPLNRNWKSNLHARTNHSVVVQWHHAIQKHVAKSEVDATSRTIANLSSADCKRRRCKNKAYKIFLHFALTNAISSSQVTCKASSHETAEDHGVTHVLNAERSFHGPSHPAHAKQFSRIWHRFGPKLLAALACPQHPDMLSFANTSWVAQTKMHKQLYVYIHTHMNTVL